MNALKISVIFLSCLLASCQEEPDRIVTQSMAFGIEPYQGKQADSSQFIICGNGMAEKLGLNADLQFSAFWESFFENMEKRNYAALIKHTHFPLRVHTGTDKTPVAYCTKKQFRQVLSLFLSSKQDEEKRIERITHFASIYRATSREDSVSIEGLLFRKAASGEWFLTALVNHEQ